MMYRRELTTARRELMAGLRDGILPFWQARALDTVSGGYITEFDGNGSRRLGRHDKHLVTQTRLIWCFSTFASVADDPELILNSARHGINFLIKRFHTNDVGIWRWKVSRTGVALDDTRYVYGQSFALYALAAFARASGDKRSRELAESTFNAIHAHAADTEEGGYFETFARSRSAHEQRKSLDTHMHLLEAFTELVRLTGDQAHTRRLGEVRGLIRTRMVDVATGAGGNQYSSSFDPLAPVAVYATEGRSPEANHPRHPAAVNLTSYGHNLELAWLLADADAALGELGASDAIVAALTRHALAHGYDNVNGGVFREGPGDADATDRDKEFWQNAEAMVGFLEAHRVTGDASFLAAFLGTWKFAREYLVHPIYGEWRTRTTETGAVIEADLGTPWKNAYHTGRSALLSAQRLAVLLESAT